MIRLRRWFKKLGKTEAQKQNIDAGLPLDFELPYPYPRNEHEDGWNWVAVNKVVSGRADWGPFSRGGGAE